MNSDNDEDENKKELQKNENSCDVQAHVLVSGK